jgi:sugar-specific transcriptional regulator TrmB
MKLENLIQRKYELELKETKQYFKEITIQEQEQYLNFYISSKEYIENFCKDLSQTYQNYLILYTTNSEFYNYLKNENEM